MDPSGIIFVVLAFAWAVYLVPKAVRHQEDVARTRSVDRFSSAMRVLARNEPEGGADDRPVAPSRPDEWARPAGSTPDPGRRAGHVRPSNVAARRAAARAAARRRRRVTLLLVAATVVVVGLAVFAVVPWWTVAVPATLTVLFLVLCRRQVRRESRASWAAPRRAQGAVTPARRAVRVDSAYGSATVDVQPAVLDGSEATCDDTVKVPVPEPDAVPVAAETADGGSLWDPLPVTLPTYVNKARASRTVRTIDLGAPGSWTSGRDEADSALVDQAGEDEPAADATLHEPRRAVGS